MTLSGESAASFATRHITLGVTVMAFITPLQVTWINAARGIFAL
jgi:hypothetical protein